MRKIILCLFGLFFCFDASVVAASSYLDTEKKYVFTAENLAQTIPDFVEDTTKQEKMVETYDKLINPENGAVSIEDLFQVCRAGGFNTYRQSGYESCRAFVLKLLENAELEAEEGLLGGFCPPAFDEKGRQQNGLKSINEKTRIGDFCSSTHIAGGEVVFKKEYNCTCAAYACNPGYQSSKGACVEEFSDGHGNCLRTEYLNVSSVKSAEEALKFCESKSIRGCKIRNAIRNFGGVKNKILCNATNEELQNAKISREKYEINSIKYYKVCGDDKGKTGKKEYCISDFFNWTQTQVEQAKAFAQDYAKLKHGNTIYCSNDHRKTGNDDYIKCATKDGSVYYEFKFDDIKESVDSDRRETERSALCRLVGGDVSIIDHNKICKKIDSNICTNKLKPLAAKYGHTVKWENNRCDFTADGDRNAMGSEDFENSLAKIEGLDNMAFFKIQVIAVRKNFVLENELESYVRGNKAGVKKFTCDPGYKTIVKADGFLSRVVGNHDDVKRCYVDDTPIDFVFDDLSEITKHQRDAGETGAKCITTGGKFDGHYCRGLTESECYELEDKLAKELKTRGWAGDGDLVDWDEKAGACELNAAQFANNVDRVGKYTAIAGLTIAGVFTGGVTTKIGIALMAVELSGMLGEMYTERKVELLPQQWANMFLTESRACRVSSCAEATLRNNFGKINQASDMLNKDVLKQVDDELARLAELLPDERLQEIMANPEAPNCWETWECQKTIFMVMQMASLVTAVGKGLVNLTRVLAKKAGAAAAKNSTALVKVASKGDEAIDIAKNTGKAADDAADAAKGAGKAADNATDAAKAANGADDAVYDAAYFAAHTSAVDDVFKGTDNVVQVARKGMPSSELRKLMRNASANGFVCTECGGDVLKFTRKADKAADAAKGAGKAADGAADAAKGASKAADDAADAGRAANSGSKAADGATGAGRAADNATDAGRAANNVADATKAANSGSGAIHPDLIAYKGAAKDPSAIKKIWRNLNQKFAADKVAPYNSPELTKRASDLQQKIIALQINKKGSSVFKELTESEMQSLSREIEEFEKALATAEAAKVADKAADATRAGAKAADDATDLGKAADGVKDAGRAADELFDAKFPGFKKVTTDGFRVSNQVFGEAVADSKVSSLFKEGYYAAKVPTKGVASGEEYVIVAVKQEGLAKDLVWNGKDLVRQIDNSAFLRNLDNYMGKEITKIGKTSVVLEEVGSDGGRAVAIMRIGERKLPFYVSTGEAGKTRVPTGKWEVFWGKGGGWFNKGGLGSLEDQERLLLDHYDSQELRQIADALNSKLGDPRDTELVLNTIGRNTKGQGFVGRANLGSISESSINSGFKYAPSSGGVNANMLNNIEDFKRYLKGLTIN